MISSVGLELLDSYVTLRSEEKDASGDLQEPVLFFFFAWCRLSWLVDELFNHGVCSHIHDFQNSRAFFRLWKIHIPSGRSRCSLLLVGILQLIFFRNVNYEAIIFFSYLYFISHISKKKIFSLDKSVGETWLPERFLGLIQREYLKILSFFSLTVSHDSYC